MPCQVKELGFGCNEGLLRFLNRGRTQSLCTWERRSWRPYGEWPGEFACLSPTLPLSIFLFRLK